MKANPRRQISLFLGIAYALALGIALLLPKTSDAAPLLSIPVPAIVTAIVIAVTVPKGERTAAWGAMRLRHLGLRVWPIAIGVPFVMAIVSYLAARLFGVARFPGLPGSLEIDADFFFVLVVFTIVFMGEEIGWRGFLLDRFAEVTSFRNAALVTGLAHGIFHLPLYLIGSTYMTEGSRAVVVPVAMVVFTFAGVIYAWVQRLGRSVWPVSIAHNSFNLAFETIGPAAVATSPAALAYVAGETGLVTLGLIVVFATVLMLRSPVFAKA